MTSAVQDVAARPLRIAFDVVLRLGFSEVELAGVLYAAAAVETTHAGWPERLVDSMLRPHVAQLIAVGGVDEGSWRELAAMVLDSHVLAAAIRVLAVDALLIPPSWIAELHKQQLDS